MPFVAHEFSISKNTLPGAPISKIYDLGINSRMIIDLEVIIPDGHKGLAYLKIETPGRVLLPSAGSSVQWIRGNNASITTGTINAVLDGPPYQIICTGYNLDVFLDHSFLINLTTGG